MITEVWQALDNGIMGGEGNQLSILLAVNVFELYKIRL
jgi:hypothetical protein